MSKLVDTSGEAMWSPRQDGEHACKGSIRPARILVVEDEELLATVIADVLGDAHKVICAGNVGDAVDHLLCGDIDLVLLDCVLPDGPNWQVALEADRQNIPTVFMTGDPEQAKELVAGGRPYLLKPFGMATLIDLIDSTATSSTAPPSTEGCRRT